MPTYHEESDTPEPERPSQVRKVVIVLLWMVGIAIAVGICVSVIYVYMNY